jgi:hypothetical protein
MRLWSIHPSYLDTKGLVALWREGLLAQNVLLGKTKGYKNHPQLNRFKATDNPPATIGTYLKTVVVEADRRQYNFDRTKIITHQPNISIPVTTGQLRYEFDHLLKKLQSRQASLYERYRDIALIQSHPIFYAVEGNIEEWEVL